MTQGPTKRSADNAPTNKPARKLKRLSPDQMTQLEYRKKVEACAASSNAVEALKIFDEMTTQAIPVQPYLYQMILNICGATTTDENIEEAAFRVFDHMKASLVQTEKSTKKYPIDESSYSALIKLCSKQLHTERALGLIAELESHNVGPKLRTFAPLLVAFASLKDLTQAWWVYEKLVEHNIEATEAEYVALFEVCTAVRNEDMFYKVLNIFLDEILVPSRSTWDVLKNWFLNEAQPWQCSVGVVDDAGICSITGSKLESIELHDDKANALLAKVENLVCDSDKRKEQWASFKEWLEAHGPFDVVIDAANVGYFNQNFEGGGFNYKQIATVLEAYQKKGLKPLVVLHKNRTRDEQVPEHHRAMVQQWKADGIMFNCLPGNNDDWYWLYAAVKLGGRTLVVSNDEMRDHHFQMIHNKDFVRWKERHLVHYKVRGGQLLQLSEPSVYSKRSQRLASSWHFPSPDNEEWLVIHRP